MKRFLMLMLISTCALADSAIQINMNAPTRRIDGKLLPLEYIDHYQVYLQAPDAHDDLFTTKEEWTVKPDATQFTLPIDKNNPGSWCIKISIVDTSNNESNLSNRVCVRILNNVQDEAPYYSLTLNVIVQQIPEIALESTE